MTANKKHGNVNYILTSSLNCDNEKIYGFYIDTYHKQSPCWFTQKKAIASAIHHIDLWLADGTLWLQQEK